MNEEHILDSNISDEFVVTETARAYLAETAKWAKFLAIVGFVMLGLIVIIAIFAGSIMAAAMSSMETGQESGVIGGGFITVIYLMMAALYFFPTFYLYRFATRTQSALQSSDSALLSGGLEQLKSCFKFIGILMIVVLALYAFGILAFFIVGGSAFI